MSVIDSHITSVPIRFYRALRRKSCMNIMFLVLETNRYFEGSII